MPICNPTDLKRLIKKGERLLCLDVGTKTVGMALSDTTLLVATPFDTIRRTRFRDDAKRLLAEIDRDLLDHPSRALLQRTGLVLERGELGAWIVGEAGAVLVRAKGRRVHCYCVKPTDPGLPGADRIAHLLLALRADESGFATVANVAFCGGRWRLRRRLHQRARQALDAVQNSPALRYASSHGSN